MGSCRSGGNQIVYDGDGNRVSKTVLTNGVPASTYYLVDDLNPTGYPQVVEELQGNTVTRQYTYGLQRIDENQFISNAWTPSFYGYDGGGNVRQLTNSAGAVTDSYEYDASGNEFTVSGSTPNEMMYRGEQYDSDLGLYYLRARYYNALTGRFMSRDSNDPGQFDPDGIPVDPKLLHKYLYANGDPVNGLDPSGREDLIELDARFEQFLRKAPTLTAWAVQLVQCVGSIGGAIAKVVQNPNTSGLTIIRILSPCGRFLFNSFRIIYAATP